MSKRSTLSSSGEQQTQQQQPPTQQQQQQQQHHHHRHHASPATVTTAALSAAPLPLKSLSFSVSSSEALADFAAGKRSQASSASSAVSILPRGKSASTARDVGARARQQDAERLSADVAFSQAMRDTATVVKLDSRILLKIALQAAAGDGNFVEAAQQHVTRNAVKLIKLVVDKLDDEQLSERRFALLSELFVEPCRLLKLRIVQVVRDAEAAVVDAEFVDVLRQSQAKLAEVVDTIVANSESYRQRLRQRSENVKAGVLRQAKRLVGALKELRHAAYASRAVLDLAARQLSDHLMFFLEIAQAAVMDDEAQLLRSSISEALACARRVHRARSTTHSSTMNGVSLSSSTHIVRSTNATTGSSTTQTNSNNDSGDNENSSSSNATAQEPLTTTTTTTKALTTPRTESDEGFESALSVAGQHFYCFVDSLTH